MCSSFRKLQSLKYSKTIVEEVEEKLRSVVVHLKFLMSICEWQAKEGRLLVFEHPSFANDWQTEMVMTLLEIALIVIVDFDFCYHGVIVPERE